MAMEKELSALRDTMERGFGGIHGRLDVLNGRVGKGEVEHGRTDVRLKNLEREVFNRRSTDREEGDEEAPRRVIAGRAITERDVHIVWLTLGAVFGVIEVIRNFGPLLERLMKP